MQEFTSISVSSYDAASLADKLTEKSSAGWDVVAIVPAGTNITAYLCRAADAAATAPSWDTGAEDTAADTDADTGAASDADATGVITTAAAYGAEDAVEEPAPVWEPEPVAEEPAPVEEPAGWAVAPEPASPSTASEGVAEASPEPAPYLQPSGSDDAGQPAAGAEPDYAGEPRLGSTTAGYDTARQDRNPRRPGTKPASARVPPPNPAATTQGRRPSRPAATRARPRPNPKPVPATTQA